MGHSFSHLWLAALASLAAAACASAPAPSSAADQLTAAGRGIVETRCASCHAIGRHDRSRHPDAPALRTLSENYPVDALEESLAEGIVVGHPDMPEFIFSADDVAAIVSYLGSIQDS